MAFIDSGRVAEARDWESALRQQLRNAALHLNPAR
jgi:hypothetical protein